MHLVDVLGHTVYRCTNSRCTAIVDHLGRAYNTYSVAYMSAWNGRKGTFTEASKVRTAVLKANPMPPYKQLDLLKLFVELA